MVVSSWSDHREKWRDAGFSNDAPPKIGEPRSHVTVVGVQRSIQLSYDRTCMRGWKRSGGTFPAPVSYIIAKVKAKSNQNLTKLDGKA